MISNRVVMIMAAIGLVVLVASAAGAFDPAGPPGNALGFRRVQTPEITGDIRVSQRFWVYAPSLDAIDLYAAATSQVRGTIVLELRSVKGDSTTIVRSAEVSAEDLVRDRRYRFQFPPIRDSRGTLYRLDISSSTSEPSSGVALWATRGEGLEDAFVSINGTQRFADLAFQTQFALPPPRSRASVWLGIAMLSVSWIAMMFVVLEVGRA